MLVYDIRNGHPGQKGDIKMYNTGSPTRKYVLVAILSAIGGGLFVTLVTKAVPKMISNMISNMMSNMMGQMRKSGFNPAEM